jgi:ABC-2 type transport system permease protein
MNVQMIKELNVIQASSIIWHKHMRKFIQNGEELFGTMIQPILWVALFGLGMKGLVNTDSSSGDFNYIGFMLPGIIALSLIGGAIGGGMIWLDERTKGIVKSYLVSPIPRMSIVLGNIFSTITKSIFQGIIILIVGVIIGANINIDLINMALALVFVALYSTGFSGIALSLASQTNDLMAYHAMIMLLNLPVLFLSNALYPASTMPGWMQVAAKLNPTTYLVDGLRQTLFSGKAIAGIDTMSLWFCLLVSGVFALLGSALAIKKINSKTRNIKS